jgi:hypothetical protein
MQPALKATPQSAVSRVTPVQLATTLSWWMQTAASTPASSASPVQAHPQPHVVTSLPAQCWEPSSLPVNASETVIYP